jgi:hypothetical protein
MASSPTATGPRRIHWRRRSHTTLLRWRAGRAVGAGVLTVALKILQSRRRRHTIGPFGARPRITLVVSLTGPTVPLTLRFASVLALAVVSVGAAQAPAQALPRATGAMGAVEAGWSSLSVSGSKAAPLTLWGLRFGLRAPVGPPCAEFRVGPEFALRSTGLGGKDLDHRSDEYGFATLSLGAYASVRIAGSIRMFVIPRYDLARAEHFDRADSAGLPLASSGTGRVWNYSGRGTSIVGGVEIPFTKAGRGLVVSVASSHGHFTSAELLKETQPLPRLRYRNEAFSVGWGGPFTVDWPWR